MKKRVFRRLGGKRRGFTLIELLIVLSILAVLAAVVVLALTGFIGRGESAACEADEAAIQTAAYSFYYNSVPSGTWPVNADGTINWTAADGKGGKFVPNYLNEEPSSDTKCTWELSADGVVCTDDANCDCGIPCPVVE